MIHRQHEAEVTRLILDNGKANALDIEHLQELERALEESADRTGAVVLTGAGKMFSGGLDLRRLIDEGPAYTTELVDVLDGLLERFRRLSIPSVAAINGHAVAGGLILACACDYRILASGPGRIGLTEMLLGVPFPPLALELVRAAVGDQRTRQMVWTGRLYSAAQAATLGLVDELTKPSELVDRATDIAGELARIPRPTFELTKRQLLAPAQRRLESLPSSFADRCRQQWVAPRTGEIMQRYVEQRMG